MIVLVPLCMPEHSRLSAESQRWFDGTVSVILSLMEADTSLSAALFPTFPFQPAPSLEVVRPSEYRPAHNSIRGTRIRKYAGPLGPKSPPRSTAASTSPGLPR